jgi:hypothetical protein
MRLAQAAFGSLRVASIVWIAGITVASASATQINTSDRGFYESSGFHDSTNKTYFTGTIPATTAQDDHNFFMFNLSAVSGTVVAADLHIVLNAFAPNGANPIDSGYKLYWLDRVVDCISGAGCRQRCYLQCPRHRHTVWVHRSAGQLEFF